MSLHMRRIPNSDKRGQEKRKLDPFNTATWGETDWEYFTSVEQAFKKGDDMLISNGKPEHAAYLIKLFIANALHDVRLISGGLPLSYEGTDVYGSFYVLAAVLDFLSHRDTKLQILIQGELKGVDDISKHPFVRGANLLKETKELRGILKIQELSLDWEETMRNSNIFWHWMTMDESAYRLEQDVTKPAAIANFGDSEYASAFVEVFDTIASDEAKNRVLTEVTP